MPSRLLNSSSPDPCFRGWTIARRREVYGQAMQTQSHSRGSALQVLVALAVIAATLFDPNKPAVGIVRLVGIVLIEAGVHARFASGLVGIFR
jgi:hypothetical protein